MKNNQTNFCDVKKEGPTKSKTHVKPIIKNLKISLEDVYNGKNGSFEVSCQRICSSCIGKGKIDVQAYRICIPCNGVGKRNFMFLGDLGKYAHQS